MDSVHLFDRQAFAKTHLNIKDVIEFKKFASNLSPNAQPCENEIEDMIKLLQSIRDNSEPDRYSLLQSPQSNPIVENPEHSSSELDANENNGGIVDDFGNQSSESDENTAYVY